MRQLIATEEAVALMPGRRQDSGKAILSTAIAQLLRQTSRINKVEAVRALCADPGEVEPDQLEEVAHWFIEVARRWRAVAD
jgi:hypothetical protein